MLTRIARYCLRNWELSILAIAILIAGVLRFSHHSLGEHWLLGTVAILTLIPWSIRSWHQIQTGTLGVNLLMPTLLIFAVGLHHFWLAMGAALLLVVLQMLDQILNSSNNPDNVVSPILAHVLRGRKTVDVASETIQPGDKLVLLPGEASPVDATVLEGASTFDESNILGGDPTVVKHVQSLVLAGSVNNDTAITVRATSATNDSYQATVTRLVSNTQTQQAPFSRLADVFALVFSLLVIGISAGAWYLQNDSKSFLAVLSVATVFPLTVTIPAIFRRSLRQLHRLGVVARSCAIFEAVAGVESVAFDASGTLTDGNLKVDAITAFKPYSDTDLLALASPLLQDSTSQLAVSLVAEAQSHDIKLSRVKHVRSLAANGVAGTVRGLRVQVGPFKSLIGVQVTTPKISSKHNGPVLYVAINEIIAGYIAFRDVFRPESDIAIHQLEKLKIKPILLTEHSSAYAKAMSAAVGTSVFFAEQTTLNKIETISDPTIRPVLYVGNPDQEPTIFTATDIGFGTGVRNLSANHGAASLFTMQQGIGVVAATIALARKTLATAKQTIVMSQLLSLALILGFVYYHIRPIYGLAAQLVIVLFSIAYALRPSRR